MFYNIHIQRLSGPGAEGLPLPGKCSDSASGYDLHAAIEEQFVLKPRQRALIPTGIAIAMPPGLEAQIRPRSGLAWKHGITCLNSPGTIDADYRGEIKVILINHGEDDFIIHKGDRIAQMVFQPIPDITWTETSSLSETERGGGGFGHTGK